MTTQVQRVFDAMSHGRWVTPRQLARKTKITLGAGLYARIRDLRKFEHGGYIVESRANPRDDGDWQYRLRTDEKGRLVRRRRPRPTAADKYLHLTKKELIAELLKLKRRRK